MFQFIFKNLIIFIFCLVFLLGCDDIPRDNILDPKNPTSERPKIVTVEAFVYTGSDAPNALNDTMLIALEQIRNTYNNKITVLEYHRNTTNYRNDPYHHNSNENLYNIYTGFIGKGVPDVFIDGTAARVQGASTVQNSVFRLDEALRSFLIENSFFTIEPTITKGNNGINFSTKIAKLGSTDAEDIIVKLIILAQYDNDVLKRVVSEIRSSNKITKLNHGETTDIDFGSDAIDPMANKAVFTVTSEDEKTIYQSIEVDIPW